MSGDFYVNFRRLFAGHVNDCAKLIEDGTINQNNIVEKYISRLNGLNNGMKSNPSVNERQSVLIYEAYVERYTLQINYWGTNILEEYATWTQFKKGYEDGIKDAEKYPQRDVSLINSRGSAYWKGFISGVKKYSNEYTETTERFSLKRFKSI